MNNIKNNISKNFTTIPNGLVNDNKLTDRARFVFVYMASKPDDWTFYNSELSKSLKYSVKTLRKYIEELIQSGWITKYEQSRINGLFTANTYIINFRPDKNSPCSLFVDTIKSHDDKKSTRQKTDTTKNRYGQKNVLNNKDLHKKGLTQKRNLTKEIKIFK